LAAAKAATTETVCQMIGTFQDFLWQDADRINVLYGGAGSGKSHSVAQELCLRFISENDIRILVTRKTLPSLRITAYPLIRDILTEWGIPFDLNKSELTITYGNNQILFKSLDDPEKVKSYEANYIWVEECTEVSYQDYLQLNLRLRRPNKNGPNRIYLTFNPIDQYHWLVTELIEGQRENVAIHHSTYKDNPFLQKEYIDELESLINQDENYYRVYTLGLPGVLKNIVYTNYKIIDWPAKTYSKDTFYGLDFGFNNPSALVEVHTKDNGLYVRELLYESGLTNTDLIAKVKPLVGTRPVYADSAEPDRITELKRAGVNVYPAKKDLVDGIDHVKRYRLYIDSDSVNLIGEIRSYKFREDKDGHVLEEPVKFRDHAMDALRYGIHTHLGKPAGRARIGSGVTRGW
jgi:phage terminase large subunit